MIWIGRNRRNSRVISAMQIDDQRVREDARGDAGTRARAAFPRRAAQTRIVSVAGIRLHPEIRAPFQRDILRRHFGQALSDCSVDLV
jgi:hypothetical protein